MNDNVRDVWSEDELDAALAALRSDVDTDRRALARSRAELLEAAGGHPPVADEPAPRRARRSLRWVAAAAAVAVVTSVGLTLLGREPPVANAAARELNSAADKIGSHDQPVGRGQYRYVGTHAWYLVTAGDDHGPYSYLEEHLNEVWMPADWRQEWMLRSGRTGNHKWIDRSDAQARADGAGLGPRHTEVRRAACGGFYAELEDLDPCAKGDWEQPNQEFMASLPRDPKQLYDELSLQHNADTSAGMLEYVAQMLRTGLVPADLRAALYRTLGMVPGLRITEKVANLNGRTGIAFGATRAEDGRRRDVIIDADTGQYIGEREVMEKGFGGVRPGTTTEFTSVITAVVEDMGDRPAG